jgi:hypothetical protein
MSVIIRQPRGRRFTAVVAIAGLAATALAAVALVTAPAAHAAAGCQVTYRVNQWTTTGPWARPGSAADVMIARRRRRFGGGPRAHQPVGWQTPPAPAGSIWRVA